jgi:hypothetical protein
LAPAGEMSHVRSGVAVSQNWIVDGRRWRCVRLVRDDRSSAHLLAEAHMLLLSGN